jgi:hypothetical protein
MEMKKGNLLEELLASITPVEQSKIDARMLLSAKIADGMKTKGWNNSDLLKAVEKESPSLVTKWLSGTHNFTTDTLVELEHALGIQLLDREEKKTSVVVYYTISVDSKSEIDCFTKMFGKDQKLVKASNKASNEPLVQICVPLNQNS